MASRGGSLASRRGADRALELLAFGNAALLPLPVEVLLVPMVLARPSRAPRLAVLATAASGVGAVYGYALGHFAAPAFETALSAISQGERLDHALQLLHAPGAVLVLVAAFAPVPFVLLTVAAGLSGYGLVAFLPFALAGRALRLGLASTVAALVAPRLHALVARLR